MRWAGCVGLFGISALAAAGRAYERPMFADASPPLAALASPANSDANATRRVFMTRPSRSAMKAAAAAASDAADAAGVAADDDPDDLSSPSPPKAKPVLPRTWVWLTTDRSSARPLDASSGARSQKVYGIRFSDGDKVRLHATS